MLATLLLSGGIATDGLAAEQTITLSPGMAKAIVFDGIAEAAVVADPAIADVTVLDNRNLIILGKSPGVTSVDVRGTDGASLAAYAVRVDAQTTHASQVVARLAGTESDIRVDAVGATLFVSGTADSPAQAARVLEGVRAVTAGEVVDSLDLAGSAQVSLEVLISEVSSTVTNELGVDWSLDINPFAEVTEWVWGTSTRLGTGAVQVGEFINQNIEGIDPFTGRTVLDLQTNELGTQLAAPRGGDGGIVFSSTHEINEGKYRLTGFLDALARNGLVTVHARPSLTTLSGEPAEFFSGLEVPVPTITDRGIVGTSYHRTGVALTFTPTVLSADQIALSVGAEVRELAVGGTVIAGAQVPNINERSADTTVELGNGQSIAIAGLYRRGTSNSNTGIPLLKDIPLWGTLFRSTVERDESAELIIVVTPTIVAGVAGSALAASSPAAGTALRMGNEFYY